MKWLAVRNRFWWETETNIPILPCLDQLLAARSCPTFPNAQLLGTRPWAELPSEIAPTTDRPEPAKAPCLEESTGIAWPLVLPLRVSTPHNVAAIRSRRRLRRYALPSPPYLRHPDPPFLLHLSSPRSVLLTASYLPHLAHVWFSPTFFSVSSHLADSCHDSSDFWLQVLQTWWLSCMCPLYCRRLLQRYCSPTFRHHSHPFVAHTTFLGFAP